MATILKKAVTPVTPVAKVAVRQVAKMATPKTVEGFTILKNVEIPAKHAFQRRGAYNDLFAQLEVGDCIEIQVEPEKTNVSKLNGLYNAARRNGASITMRVHAAGEDGKHGGILRMWYNGMLQSS